MYEVTGLPYVATKSPPLGHIADPLGHLNPVLNGRLFFGTRQGEAIQGDLQFWTGTLPLDLFKERVVVLGPDTLASAQYAHDRVYSNVLLPGSLKSLKDAGGRLEDALRRLQRTARESGLTEKENVLEFVALEDLIALLLERFATREPLSAQRISLLRHRWNSLMKAAQALTQEENRYFGL